MCDRQGAESMGRCPYSLLGLVTNGTGFLLIDHPAHDTHGLCFNWCLHRSVRSKGLNDLVDEG